MKAIVLASTTLFAVIAATGAIAAADCRLDQDTCMYVDQEVEAYYLSRAQDAALYSSLRRHQREQVVIERSEQRLRARASQLEPRVRDELYRILLCHAQDRLAAAHGTVNRRPGCSG